MISWSYFLLSKLHPLVVKHCDSQKNCTWCGGGGLLSSGGSLAAFHGLKPIVHVMFGAGASWMLVHFFILVWDDSGFVSLNNAEQLFHCFLLGFNIYLNALQDEKTLFLFTLLTCLT